MGMMTKVAVVAVSASILSGCETSTLQDRPNTVKGAGIGTIAGALLGRAVFDDERRGTRVGAVVGGIAGAAIGNNLDEQERALRGSIGQQGALITNTGDQLIVTLPEEITFDFNSSVVKSRFVGSLGQLAANLNQYPNSIIQVIGHTDNVGSVQFNNNLSLERANAVARVLINSGVSGGRISTGGDGEFNPIASNSTAAGRAQNRRVVITITPT
jgi:outer membrane protein OmpA-like peptidoglycan-associated protein